MHNHHHVCVYVQPRPSPPTRLRRRWLPSFEWNNIQLIPHFSTCIVGGSTTTTRKNHTGIKYLPKRSIHNIRVPTRCCLAHDSHLARTTSSSHKVIPLQCIYLCEVNMASFCFRNLFNFYDNNVPIITALPPTAYRRHRALGFGPVPVSVCKCTKQFSARTGMD